MKKLAMLAIALLPIYASAKMYKCEVNGKKIYQDKPCKSGNQSTIKAPPTPKFNASDIYAEGIELGRFETRADAPNSIGDIWFAYSVPVTNKTDYDHNVVLKYQGVDNSGFLVKDVNLRGTVPAHSYKILTDRSVLEIQDAQRITRWVREQ